MARKTFIDETHTALVRRARRMAGMLGSLYPDAHCELDFTTPLELLVATILSAQCTDKRVNMVTPALFAKYPDAAAYAGADRAELESLIQSTGFFRAKANSLLGMAQALCDQYGGEVPPRLDDLVRLPGVGRKTANVVLGNAFGVPGLTVDTHFGRLARRFGWTGETDPVKVEIAVGDAHPEEGLDRPVPPVDLARPPGLPLPQARLRCLHARRPVPVVRGRADGSGRRGRAGARGALLVTPRLGRLARARGALALVVVLGLAACAPSASTSASGKRTEQTVRLIAAAGLPDCPASGKGSAVKDGLPDLTLPCLGDGPAVQLAGLRGRPMLVNVWAAPCEPCQREAASLQKAYVDGTGRLDVLGVVDLTYPGESIDDALDGSRGLGIRYPSVVDAQGKVRQAYRSVGIPITLFVTADGTVAFVQRGEIVAGELPGLVERYLGVKL